MLLYRRQINILIQVKNMYKKALIVYYTSFPCSLSVFAKNMMTITREQAICMLYCATYTEENVKKLVPMINALQGLKICYKEDPMESVLFSSDNLKTHTAKCRKYPATIQSLDFS
ncbi:uncharacterized protein B0P05DRAFT_548704 [Gilbertella persicaria]|uniref:uncharacterized protein n=1 Tax=Gilbertella persicaria TaxID=101096 RepID=UPI00221FA0F0|nr:uncharacterized protein B0P05DRAFT_548704 [Gilbertella persicaria]KAI8073475.1 hypothetical protein B0P05DRAFT_548704 [Gilbertella persicaria]